MFSDGYMAVLSRRIPYSRGIFTYGYAVRVIASFMTLSAEPLLAREASAGSMVPVPQCLAQSGRGPLARKTRCGVRVVMDWAGSPKSEDGHPKNLPVPLRPPGGDEEVC